MNAVITKNDTLLHGMLCDGTDENASGVKEDGAWLRPEALLVAHLIQDGAWLCPARLADFQPNHSH